MRKFDEVEMFRNSRFENWRKKNKIKIITSLKLQLITSLKKVVTWTKIWKNLLFKSKKSDLWIVALKPKWYLKKISRLPQRVEIWENNDKTMIFSVQMVLHIFQIFDSYYYEVMNMCIAINYRKTVMALIKN